MLKGRCGCVDLIFGLGFISLGCVKVRLSGVVRLLGVIQSFLGPVAGDCALAGRLLALEVFCLGMDDPLVWVPCGHCCLSGRLGARSVLFGPSGVQSSQLLGDPVVGLGVLFVPLCVRSFLCFVFGGLLGVSGFGGGELVS